MKTAILIGATGLVGKQVLDQLLQHSEIDKIRIFTRQTTGVIHPKIKEYITDFNALNEQRENITGDVLFSTLGTTKKAAGSKKAQYAIDFDMQFDTAKIASENGVKQLVLLSSAGASADSSIFYSKMKGELDEAVKTLPFDKISIIRPSMLAGDRKEFRLTERIFTPIMYALSWVPGIKKYRPIKDTTVAKAMLNAIHQHEQYKIYELEGVFDLAGK